jgi:uncharacterized phiE125 gp8 family phage protein
MALSLVAGPTVEPITLPECKLFMRVDVNADDALIESLIVACRQAIDGRDGWLGRALCTQTWDLVLDGFRFRSLAGFHAGVRLPLAPVSSVTSIKYLDLSGVLQTLDPSLYVTDFVTEPARITPVFGAVWPSTYYQVNALTIRFVAGYGAAADVPEGIKLGLKAMVAHFYENREPVAPGLMAVIPLHVEHLLAPYRMFAMAA